MNFGDHKVMMWPASKEGWCRYYRAMDALYATMPDSPLHHDNRCKVHRKAES